MNTFELTLLDKIQELLGGPFLDAVMPIITLFGEDGLFFITASVLLMCFKSTRKMGLTMLLSMALGLLFGNLVLKNLFGRIRPYNLNPDFPLLIERLSDFSFPSGHTLASFEAATSVFLYNKKFGIAAFGLATLIAFSRLYLYVHYPSDVIASILLAVAVTLVVHLLIKKYYDQTLGRLEKRFLK